MYAVVRTGGKQYKVKQGDRLRVATIPAEKGASIDLGEVLALHDGEQVRVGTPVVDGAAVQAKVLGHGRDRKVIVYKYKRRKGYHKKQGHRQNYTEVLVQSLSLGGETLVAPEPEKADAAPEPVKDEVEAAPEPVAQEETPAEETAVEEAPAEDASEGEKPEGQ